MNVIVWISLANIIILCLVMWQLRTCFMLVDQLEELLINSSGRLSNILDKCIELKDKNKHDEIRK